jgi:hypothetical protein
MNPNKPTKLVLANQAYQPTKPIVAKIQSCHKDSWHAECLGLLC